MVEHVVTTRCSSSPAFSHSLLCALRASVVKSPFRPFREFRSQRDCKPNFVFMPLARNGENHLSQQPYPSLCSFRNAERTAPRASYLALHPAGFSVPRRSLTGRWSLTPPFHPYRIIADPAVYSLWHFPSARLETRSPHVLPLARITWRRVLWCSDFPLRVSSKRSSVPLKPAFTIP
jgi:hypothetical protein